MIVPKIETSRGFAGLVSYVMGADKGVKPGEFRARNIFNVERAAEEMELVASRNGRARNPVCHIIVSWAGMEDVTIPKQLAAGDKLLAALGLVGHQALIVPHQEPKQGVVPGPDGRHFEMHIVVNRVNAAGRVNRLSHSYRTAEVAAARISRELGFAVVPGRFNGEGIQKPGIGATIGSIQGETGRPTIANDILDDPVRLEKLRHARKEGWAFLLREFAAQGIVISAPPVASKASKGRAKRGLQRGLVMIDVADPSRRIKLSALDSPYEKWGETALVRELGLVPAAMLKAAADDARSRRIASGTQTHPQASTERSGQSARYQEFLDERERVKGEKDKQIAESKRKRSVVYEEAKLTIDRALALARLRRHAVRSFFGRKSLVGVAINTLLDHRLGARLAEIRLRRDDTLRQINATAVRDRVRVPRWAEWNRAQPKQSAAGLEIASSTESFRPSAGRPIRGNPTHNRPVFGAAPYPIVRRRPPLGGEFRQRINTPSR